MEKDNQNGLKPDRIMKFAFGYAPTLIIEAAVHHGVFDQLDGPPRTLDDLAARTKTSPRGLRAVLNALVGLELLARQGDRYALTEESAVFLVSRKASFHGALFQHMSGQLLPKWLCLNEIVKTGRPAATVNHDGEGEEFFAQFVESLLPLSYAAAQKLGEHLRVVQANSRFGVLDLGAGSGVWGIALAQQSPHVQVRAVDWPKVLEVTRRVAQRHGVADRLTCAPGDLLQADFGTGHQVATMGHILHSEGPERSQQLLRRAYAALAPGGTLAIMEFLPNDDRTGPAHALLFAVNMLVNTDHGDTFTFPEIGQWLRDAGFTNARLLDVPAQSPLILATKP